MNFTEKTAFLPNTQTLMDDKGCEELELNYIRPVLQRIAARRYAPALGRYLRLDPLADEFPSWSPYNYVMNNPLIYIDPDGNSPKLILLYYAGKAAAAKLGIAGGAKATAAITETGVVFEAAMGNLNSPDEIQLHRQRVEDNERKKQAEELN